MKDVRLTLTLPEAEELLELADCQFGDGTYYEGRSQSREAIAERAIGILAAAVGNAKRVPPSKP